MSEQTIDEKMAQILKDVAQNGQQGRDSQEQIESKKKEAKEIIDRGPIPPPEIKPEITKDKMTVFLNVIVYNPQQQVTPQEIVAKLNSIGVVYGINNQIINEFCENRQFFKSIRAATGLQPTKGDDGFLTFFFRKEISNAPVELADGTLDFKNMNNIENVSKDDLLCQRTPAQPGVDGMDVMGNPVPSAMGKEAVMPIGKNIVISEDGLSAYAGIEGEISYRNNTIIIEDCKIIKGDVGPGTGNIEYNGSVIVNGEVMEGFSVKATKNITIKGNVEGAQIVAGGDIALLSGINGMSKGIVKADGDITAKYVENVTIDCGGTFRTDVAINCIVWSKGAIIVKGKNGAILSGSYMANDYIYVKTVGTENRNNASLMVQNLWYLKSINDKEHEQHFDVRANARDMGDVQKNLDNVARAIEAVKSPNSPFESPADKGIALKKYILLKSQLNQQMMGLQRQLEAYEKGKDKSSLRVICPGVIHPGGKIILDRHGMKIEHALHNQKVFLDHGEIAFGPILPHEKDIN